jgi:hypothetical protein
VVGGGQPGRRQGTQASLFARSHGGGGSPRPGALRRHGRPDAPSIVVDVIADGWNPT